MEEKLNIHSKIKDVYANPVGHDIIHKLLLQMNKNDMWVTNPIVRNLKLFHIMNITKKQIDSGFFETLLNLLNSEQDVPKVDIPKVDTTKVDTTKVDTPHNASMLKQNTAIQDNSQQNKTMQKKSHEITKLWWKEAVIYQIYPRSFYDSNGDGIGDIPGIIAKLDYLKELGIDAIWLSPIYDSPNDDNGYDIRDYYSIQSDFGTMEDFDRLLEEVHKRGMKLILDLVVNHTSDEHPWFREALAGNLKYKNYYHFQKSKDENPPNNWTSFFGGSAWNYYKEFDEWGLHLFSKKQMDLNWDNQELRNEIKSMIRWWLKKGVDGFRMDVINYISKEKGLPDGNETIGKLMGYYGIEHYFYGPKLHRYLRELKEEAFEPYTAFTVGETPGVGMEMSKLLTADYRRELDMVFSFDHLETPGHIRFEEYQYNLNYLKEYMIDYMEHYDNHCVLSLFYENHDNPRMISKVNPDPVYREVLGKLLAMIQLTLKGTPFIYQGQEIGAVNKKFDSIANLRDIESINLYNELKETMEESTAFSKVLSGSRDHARTPMQWDDTQNAGFTKGTPWSYIDGDYKNYNVDKECKDKDSVWNFYRNLITLRKREEAFIYGDFICLNKEKKDLFTFLRRMEKKTYLIECNLSQKQRKRNENLDDYELILSNYSDRDGFLRPFEANLYKKIKEGISFNV